MEGGLKSVIPKAKIKIKFCKKGKNFRILSVLNIRHNKLMAKRKEYANNTKGLFFDFFLEVNTIKTNSTYAIMKTERTRIGILRITKK